MRGAIVLWPVLLAACASSSSAKKENPSAPLVVTPMNVPDAGAAESPVRGELDITVLSKNGDYWHGILDPDPPGQVLRTCVDQNTTDAGSWRAGWAIYEVQESGRMKLLQSSSSLSPSQLDCVTKQVSGLRPLEPSWWVGLLVYVSFR